MKPPSEIGHCPRTRRLGKRSLPLRDTAALPQASQEGGTGHPQTLTPPGSSGKLSKGGLVPTASHQPLPDVSRGFTLQRSCSDTFLRKQGSNTNTVYTVAEKPPPQKKEERQLRKPPHLSFIPFASTSKLIMSPLPQVLRLTTGSQLK